MSCKTPQICTIVKNMDITFGTIPEGGDASTFITQNVQTQKRRSETPVDLNKTDTSQCPLLKLSTNFSTSVIDTALYSHLDLVEHGILSSDNQPDFLSVESCGFPYYRTYKSCRGLEDIVLVKDAGISCTLLGPETNNSKPLGRSSNLLEKFLLNQLKMEYNDLSDITKKISSYTKDILQNLSLKKKKKEKSSFDNMQLSKEQFKPVVMQYIDKSGQPCLKLRLVKSNKFSILSGLECLSCWNIVLPKKASKMINIDDENKSGYERGKMVVRPFEQLMYKHSLTDDRKRVQYSEFVQSEIKNHKSNVPWHHIKQVRQLYPTKSTIVELESSTCSSSSIYNFLVMRDSKKNFNKEATKECIYPKFKNYPTILNTLNKNYPT